MRRLGFALVGTCVVALCAAGGALASPLFTQTASVKLTSPAAGASTGLSVRLSASDPGEPSGPKAAELIVIELAAGTAADTSAAPRCSLPREEIVMGRCPAGSVVGRGTATMQGGFPASPEPRSVEVINRGGGLALRTVPPADSSAEPSVLAATLSRRGVLAIAVTQSGSGPFAGFESSLTFLSFTIAARSERRGRGRAALLRAPRRCARRGLVNTTTIAYADATALTRASRQGCRRR